ASFNPRCAVEQGYRPGAGAARGQGVSRHSRRPGLRRGKRCDAEVCVTVGPCRTMDGRAAQCRVLCLRRQLSCRCGIIMDVEASRAIRQAEVGASRTMIERTEARFGIKPEWLAADTAYGAAPNLDWLVNTQGIAPHVPVIDKSAREDGTSSREDFIYDEAQDRYVCPAGKTLTTGRCCPKTPQRKVMRSIHEPARDVARAIARTAAFSQPRRDRKKFEMLFAHLKRILRLVH